MLVIFGLFAWFPIVRAFVMSVQDTNLVSDPVFVGLQNFQRVLADPLLGSRSGTRPGSRSSPWSSASPCRSSSRSS
jgi:ABC-type sugar transport system permease subunit